MNMIAENSARNHYGLYAVEAGRAEREQNRNKAAELWRKALPHACSHRSRHWAGRSTHGLLRQRCSTSMG
ncbi:ANR family transcriptional regulator [Serratia symbiotica]|uniref:ANR family transcriptional regulator n=1 Tax=Serratia symbiotica TaxID=138074 RepID=UPI0020903C82|nr:ANR family transcriptional regulator [Serratia symbiotica]USS96316.1 ANR family transcriptional regulator [Serratia symbiotica]